MLSYIIYFVGLVVLVQGAVRMALWFYTSYLRPLDLSKYRSLQGQSWALVTGATDGIGLAYAKALARERFNVILIGRNKEKLETVKAEIASHYPTVSLQCIVNDAQNVQVENIVDAVQGKELGILVNNVGMGHDALRLENLPEEEIRKLVLVNALFPTLLTKGLIPSMLQSIRNGTNNKGLIINISSTAALANFALLTVYSGTKAFNRSFSQSLAIEYAKAGIDVQCVCPGFVATKMIPSEFGAYSCRPEDCADCSLRRHDQVDVLIHLKHVIFMVFFWTFEFVFPPAWQPAVMAKLYNF